MSAAHEPTSRRVVALFPDPDDAPTRTTRARTSHVEDAGRRGARATSVHARATRGAREPRTLERTEHSGIHDQPRARRRDPLPEDIELALTNLGEDVYQLTVAIREVETRMVVASYEPAVLGLAESVEDRLHHAKRIRDTLAAIHLIALHPGPRRLLENEAPLPPFLKGVVIWCDGVVDALRVLAVELESRDADWLGLHKRLDDAARFLFPALVIQVRAHLDALREEVRLDETRREKVSEMSYLLEELFAVIRHLNVALKRME